MVTPNTNNIQGRREVSQSRIDKDTAEERGRIPDRPVDQLDDERKKNKFNNALLKGDREKKITDIAASEEPVTIGGAYETISPFDLAGGKGLIAKVDASAQTSPQVTPKATSTPQQSTPTAPPVTFHATPEMPRSTPTTPSQPHATPHVAPQQKAHEAPVVAPGPSPKIVPETTPPTAPQIRSETAIAYAGEEVDLSDFPEIQLGQTLPKVEVGPKQLNVTGDELLQALQATLPTQMSQKPIEVAIATDATVTAARPDLVARRAAVDMAEQMIQKMTTVTAGDKVETRIELRYPPLFEGVTLVITEFNTSKKEFNVSFFNLHNPDARALVESKSNQEMLKTELANKGYVLHNVMIEAKVESPIAPNAGEGLDRGRGEGEEEQDLGDLGQRKQGE